MAAKRFTTRIGLDQAMVEKLERKNAGLLSRFVSATTAELVQELDMPITEVRMLQQIAQRELVGKGSRLTLGTLLSEDSAKLATGLPQLDLHLQGGIASGCITEVVGAPGVGKTQFCHMLVLSALKQKPNNSILYIDTENRFSAPRIKELMVCENELQPNGEMPYPNMEAAIQKIMIQPATSSDDFTHYLSGLENVVITNRVGLIVVDSVANLVRAEFTSSASFAQRQAVLMQWATALKTVAEQLSIPIIVTNQVASAYAGPSYHSSSTSHVQTVNQAALGVGWHYAVNTRLTLRKSTPSFFGLNDNVIPAFIRASCPPSFLSASEYELRSLAIAKSPLAPVVSFPFVITRGGLCLLKQLSLDPLYSDDASDTYLEVFETGNYWADGA